MVYFVKSFGGIQHGNLHRGAIRSIVSKKFFKKNSISVECCFLYPNWLPYVVRNGVALDSINDSRQGNGSIIVISDKSPD